MRILIIGGSRFVGPLLVRRLLQKKHEVTVFNRGLTSPEGLEGAEFIKGDRNQPLRLHTDYDAVIDMCAYTGEHTKNALDSLDFGFFIHMGTAAAYKKTEIFPLTEDSPLGEWPLWGDYNRGKVGCELALEESGVKYASIRPVYILGEKNYVERESFIYSSLLSGKELVLPGNGGAVVQFVFAGEVADAVALAVEKKAKGAFNCAGGNLVTLRGLVAMMAEICGSKAKIRTNPKADGGGFREDEFPFANENFICSNEKIKGLGARFGSLKENLERDYRSFYGPTLR
ncbi:MAG: NAD-dependent epimerase/dehydratase family protein, partial [Candidatus Micrarchaeota archaeon]